MAKSRGIACDQRDVYDVICYSALKQRVLPDCHDSMSQLPLSDLPVATNMAFAVRNVYCTHLTPHVRPMAPPRSGCGEGVSSADD